MANFKEKKNIPIDMTCKYKTKLFIILQRETNK